MVILILTMFVLSWIPELKLKLSGKERGRHNPTPNVISTMVNQGTVTAKLAYYGNIKNIPLVISRTLQ